MSKKTTLWFLLSIILVFFAAGCKCNTGEIAVFDILLDSPPDGSIVSSLTPTFEWHDNESCTPDDFWINVKINGEWGNHWNDTSGTASDLTWPITLESGREYKWWMKARVSGEPDGPESDPSYFLTGPACTEETLVAPELTIPAHPYWISHLKPQEFAWTYSGGCLPESFKVQFAADPGFSTILLEHITTGYTQHIFETFPNCSTLFWRVAAMDGSTTGPWSDVDTFHWVKDDTCWQLHWPSEDSALIEGRVWFDDCPLTNWFIPWDPNFNLSIRCTISGGIGIHGNGVSDLGENGLEDVRVDLGAGPCPSTGLDHVMTNWWGHYDFTVLTPGTYCVSVNKMQTVPDVDLPNGLWTELLTEDPMTEITIAFSGGLQTVTQDFGWDDYEQLFVLVEMEQDINCRKGPYMDCEPLEIPRQGDLVRLLAQDPNSDWKQAAVKGKECYLYLRTETKLPPYPPPPPCPTPTPTPKPKPKPSGDVDCSQYKNPIPCREAGCTWYPTATSIAATSNGYCAK